MRPPGGYEDVRSDQWLTRGLGSAWKTCALGHGADAASASLVQDEPTWDHGDELINTELLISKGQYAYSIQIPDCIAGGRMCGGDAICGGLGLTQSAEAAQPPAGYPTDQIMANIPNSVVGMFPICRGFYDGDIDQGWGMDKAWNKHNIWSLDAMQKVMMSPNVERQGAQAIMHAYAGKYECSGSTCKLVEQKELRGIYDSQLQTNYYGWPVNGMMGLLTMYCIQSTDECPDWVTYSILYPGLPNPYSRAETLDSKLPASQKAEQEEVLTSREITSLEESVVAGRGRVAFGYEPLPASLPVS